MPYVVRSTGRAARDRADLCPGALTLHDAADGGLARVRLPGGVISADQLRTLTGVAVELGDGRLELTSRGSLQVRGLPTGAAEELAQRLAQAGLLPSPTHERARNVVASPLSGLDGAGQDVMDLVRALDDALCATPALQALPGRFLFALDDGRGDVARLGADVTLVAGGNRVTIGGLAVARADAVQAMLAVAAAFLAERSAQQSQAWRIGELDDGVRAVEERALRMLPGIDVAAAPYRELPTAPPRPAGALRQVDGRSALTLLAPLGRLTSEQAGLLAEHSAARGLRITPWRSIVLPDLTEQAAATIGADAASAGLGTDPGSPWYRISACTGRPGCAKALADVQADARAATDRWPGRRVHWSGCERRCGRPNDTEVDVVATAEGYAVHG